MKLTFLYSAKKKKKRKKKIENKPRSCFKNTQGVKLNLLFAFALSLMFGFNIEKGAPKLFKPLKKTGGLKQNKKK